MGILETTVLIAFLVAKTMPKRSKRPVNDIATRKIVFLLLRYYEVVGQNPDAEIHCICLKLSTRHLLHPHPFDLPPHAVIYWMQGNDMRYTVIINKSEYGYDVRCPVLPGCYSQGDTSEEAIENIKDAIKTYLHMIAEETKDATVYEVEVSA